MKFQMKRNKLYLNIAGAVVGAVLGYIYWYYWGCENGCTIKSVWWRMTGYGLLMGYLFMSMFGDYFLGKTKKA